MFLMRRGFDPATVRAAIRQSASADAADEPS
jgi:hypothetical protein